MICLKCNSLIDESAKFIVCDGCSRHIHTKCSELSASEIKCLELRQTTKRRIKYICIDCEKGIQQIPKLMAIINELKSEINELKNVTFLNSAPANTMSPQTCEELIAEMTERSKRSKNIIIYGSSETGDSRKNQLELDVALTTSLLDKLNISENNIQPQRLGKFDASKENSRPIKLSLQSPDTVHQIIKNFKKLKTSNVFSSITISFDRTPKQIEYYKLIKNNLNERLKNGENNLVIKYKHGIPVIQTEN